MAGRARGARRRANSTPDECAARGRAPTCAPVRAPAYHRWYLLLFGGGVPPPKPRASALPFFEDHFKNHFKMML